MRVAMCPLVSRDLSKAIRCVKSCLNHFPVETIKVDVVPIVNSLDNNFIREFVEWCEDEQIAYKITRSNGTAPRGKNSILDFFLNSDYDGCSIVDGDDVWYPTSMQQIERHLRRHPGTDLLIVKPSDTVISFEHDNYKKIKENCWATLWGNNIFSLRYIYGPGTHPMFSEGRHACSNLGGHVFYSRKLASKMRYDEEQLLGEDLLSEFEILKLHQQGELTFWLSFASDVQLLDRTMSDNIQSKLADKEEFYYNRIIEKVKTFLPVDRSSFYELPVEFPPLLFSYEDKARFISENF
jgi:hypothetical protein